MIVNVIAATWLAGKVPSVTLRMQITILKQFLLLLEKRSRIIKSTEIASTCKVRLHDLLNKVHSYEIKLQQSTLLLTSFYGTRHQKDLAMLLLLLLLPNKNIIWCKKCGAMLFKDFHCPSANDSKKLGTYGRYGPRQSCPRTCTTGKMLCFLSIL